MKVYITKYALSRGIWEADAEICPNTSEKVIRTNIDGTVMYFLGEGKEWHQTKDEAIARAKEMQAARLKSLEKQRKKLEGMVF